MPIGAVAASTCGTAYTVKPASTPYPSSDIPSSGTISGSSSTTAIPSTAVNAIDDATSFAEAPITGATAAIAEFPQIEFPAATSTAIRTGSPIHRPTPYENPSTATTVPAIPASNPHPAAATVCRLMLAPSSSTATSSTAFAQNPIPRPNRAPGTHAVRTAVPSKIASTSASTQARPNTRASTRSSPSATPVTATQSPIPGQSGGRPATRAAAMLSCASIPHAYPNPAALQIHARPCYAAPCPTTAPPPASRPPPCQPPCWPGAAFPPRATVWSPRKPPSPSPTTASPTPS